MATRPKTLGDMSVPALIQSADNEYQGLMEWIEKEFSPTEDQARWMRAYSGSIRARMYVAMAKVEDVINVKKPTISLEGSSVHD